MGLRDWRMMPVMEERKREICGRSKQQKSRWWLIIIVKQKVEEKSR